MSDWFKVAVEREYIKSFEYEFFENKEEIGKGGFGTVYSAYSKDIDLTIALKKLHHSSINNDDSFHPTTETIYMVLQYANNGDLRSYLRNHFSELDWPSKIKMAKEISSGINCLHNANIVHRDLNLPQNTKLQLIVYIKLPETIEDKIINFFDFTEFSCKEKIDISVYKSEWTNYGLTVVLKGIRFDLDGSDLNSFVHG
ncbi:33562_t:CDS:2, partial [Gigaspora margarita]